MGWIVDQLRNGRLAGIAAKIESGEPVDWRKEQQLQAIDIVRAGQQALADAIEREEIEDGRIQQLVNG